jgi:hypothetical protein
MHLCWNVFDMFEMQLILDYRPLTMTSRADSVETDKVYRISQTLCSFYTSQCCLDILGTVASYNFVF